MLRGASAVGDGRGDGGSGVGEGGMSWEGMVTGSVSLVLGWREGGG